MLKRCPRCDIDLRDGLRKALRRLRFRYLLTIEQAAARIGVNPSTWRRWESGHYWPTLTMDEIRARLQPRAPKEKEDHHA